MDAAQTRTSGVKVGDKAPDFTLPQYPQGSFTLGNQQGKTTVLYFYPKDDTPGCTKQANSFRELLSEFKTLGAEIYGVSADPLESHKAFAEKYNLNFPLLSDTEGRIRTLYGNPDSSNPPIDRMTYIIDKEGTVRHIVGPDNPTVEDHIEQSLQWARQLAD